MPGKTITRAHLSTTLRKKGGLSREQSLDAIEIVFKEITQILKEDKNVKIPLFGVFFSRHKKARVGRNPKTLEKATISARHVVGVHMSRSMKERVNMSLKKKKIKAAT